MMRITRRRRAIAVFVSLGVCMVGVALTLQGAWVVLNWRRLVPLVVGIPFFALLIAGLILNTIFLVREVRRNERHDSFLNAVTHELKTPIASIRLYLETLQRRSTTDQQRQEFYRIMLADSDRLLATVEQVLKAGEVGQRPKNKLRARVDMERLAAECVETTRQRHHLEPGAISLVVLPHQLPMVVRGDQGELQTALLNVLDNAIKYSPNGLNIEVRLALEEDTWVLVRVTDSGLGIPTAHLKRVFKRFYRVPRRSTFQMKGTGLGLFLVRSIVRQHGGDVSASSAGEGKGATISMQLPRLLNADLEAATTAEMGTHQQAL
ncbi:MAG TPA: HAMP domain-containing sensor histidine kinase [Acidisarcina sp.]